MNLEFSFVITHAPISWRNLTNFVKYRYDVIHVLLLKAMINNFIIKIMTNELSESN